MAVAKYNVVGGDYPSPPSPRHNWFLVTDQLSAGATLESVFLDKSRPLLADLRLGGGALLEKG